MALCKLLQHSLNADDKRLQDIVVKGEEIYSPDEGIRTRSKSAKSKTLNKLHFNIFFWAYCSVLWKFTL